MTGVATEISADEFFDKCLDGTLTESDFSFNKPNQSEAQTKGAVRDKIRVLPDIGFLFSPTSIVEEGFNQNSIKCVFAAEGGTFTLGFTCKPNSKPMTLLRGQKLDASRSAAMELVLRRPRGSKKFDKIIVGSSDSMKKYSGKLQNLLADELLKEIQNSVEEENNPRNTTETDKTTCSGITSIEQAKKELLIELVQQNALSIDTAAEKLGLSVDQFQEQLSKET